MSISFRARMLLSAPLRLNCISLLLLTVWSWPLWWAHNRWGVDDWGYCNQRIEAIRATVVEFGQWPGNNPWTTGGVPLIGNPAINIFSLPGILSLFLGAQWANHLSILILVYIGWLGSWALSGLWWKEKWTRIIFSLYIVGNPALIYHCTGGHLAFLNYYFLPAALYFFLRFKTDPWSGLKAGLILGVAFLHSVSYMIQYAFVVFFPILLWEYFSSYRTSTGKLVRWCVLFSLTFGAACIYRILTILPVAEAFPRIAQYKYHLTANDILRVFFQPLISHGIMVNPEKIPYCNSATELCSYVGICAPPLFLYSLFFKRRWWHAAALVLVWASIGNDSPYYIMYWLQKLPVFSSHLCYARIRIFTSLFVGLAIADSLNILWDRCKTPKQKAMVFSLGALVAAEILATSHAIMKEAHVSAPTDFYSNYSNEFQNYSSFPLTPPHGLEAAEFQCQLTYFSTLQNMGYLHGLGDSYIPDDTLALGRDEKGYIGEFHQEGHPVIPQYWSPNRIVLEGLNPEQPLTVNMNPGSPWYLNGRPAFPGTKIVELKKRFIVMPDKNGTVELTYHAPGHIAGLLGTLVMLLALVGSIVYFARKIHVE